jgi:hypothetical protein
MRYATYGGVTSDHNGKIEEVEVSGLRVRRVCWVLNMCC